MDPAPLITYVLLAIMLIVGTHHTRENRIDRALRTYATGGVLIVVDHIFWAWVGSPVVDFTVTQELIDSLLPWVLITPPVLTLGVLLVTRIDFHDLVRRERRHPPAAADSLDRGEAPAATALRGKLSGRT